MIGVGSPSAFSIYDAVLKDHPNSAWAQFERFQTRMALAVKDGKPIEEAHAAWPDESRAIYGCDPLFSHSAGASTGAELYHVFRRMESAELFKDRSKTADDVIKYADIALDLARMAMRPQFTGMLSPESTPRSTASAS